MQARVGMSERKVLNKYIPPNFDPARIPKRQGPKNAQHTVRLMAPFSMRCSTCHEYIYKGRKFNARKEPTGTFYLTIRIFRFYIRCPQCGAEITYTTDPEKADYQCEAGATRNFEPWREEKAEEERAALRRKLEETHNPMKALENKTFDAKRELELMEALDEIRTRNARLERVDADAIFERVANEDVSSQLASDQEALRTRQREQEEEDAMVRDAFAAAQRREQPTPMLADIHQVSTKDLLLGSGLDNATTVTRKVELGIVLRPKKTRDTK